MKIRTDTMRRAAAVLALACGAALVAAGCSVNRAGSDAGAALERVRQDMAGEGEAGESAAAPSLPADWVPDPVVGRPEATPAIRIGPMRPAELSFRECVAYALPNWDIEVVLAHRSDKPVRLDERRAFRFNGGGLAAFLARLEQTWDLAVTAPSTGQLEVSTRRVEVWLVTHWMRPPEAVGGPGIGADSGFEGQNGDEAAQNRRSSDGRAASGGSGSTQLTAEAFDGLGKLVSRLARIAGHSQLEGVQPADGGNEGGSVAGESESVWINEEAGLLYAWASPNALRAMRPLLTRYGARPVAADPEVLAMMTWGHFRLRLSLIRVSVTNDRNASLRWSENLQAVLPAGAATTGLSGYGYGDGGTGRLNVAGSAALGAEGVSASLGMGEIRNRAVYPYGTRSDLTSEQQRQLAYQEAINIDRSRTQADLDALQSRISDLETDLDSGLNGGDSAQARRELTALKNQAAGLRSRLVDLGEEAARAAARAARAGAWLARITEADERAWARSLETLVSLGSAHGHTETVQTVSINARHGQLHPLQVGSERTYIGRIQQNISQSFSQQSAEPETRLEGLALSMLPWLESRRCVRVGLALQNSGVTSIATFAVGGTQLAIPQMAVQTWRAEYRLCDAEPAVVARFKLASRTRSGGGIPVWGDREVPLGRQAMEGSEEYLLLVQAVLPPEWGLR